MSFTILSFEQALGTAAFFLIAGFCWTVGNWAAGKVLK